MLLSPYFVFVHIPKTGGSFVTKLLLDHLPPECRLAQGPDMHAPVSQIPDVYRPAPRFGFIRNPWDWYVSWYHYMMEQKPPHALFTSASQGAEADFATTLENLLTLNETFEKNVRSFRDDPRARSPQQARRMHLLVDAVGIMRRLNIGFLTWRYLYSFCPNADSLFQQRALESSMPVPDAIRIGRFEALRDSLTEMIREFRIPHSEATIAAIHTRPPENASQRQDYSSYYEPRLRDLVAAKDRIVLRHFGYDFST
jgi:hypothetical protein